MKKTIACILLAVCMTACSTAPKDDGSVNEIKNQAAEYAQFGNRYYQTADYRQALKFFSLALELNTSVDNEIGIAESHGSLGKVYMRTGDPEAAEYHFLKAYELAGYLGADMKLKAAGNLCEYRLTLEDAEGALKYLREGLEYAKENPESVEAAVLYHNAAAVYKRQEEYERAVSYIEKALSINEEHGAYLEMAANYYVLSSIASKQGSIEEALNHAEQALIYDKMVENSTGIAGDLFALGLLYRKAGKNAEALRYFEKAYNVYETLDIPSGVRKSLENLVEVGNQLGKTDEVELYTRALELLELRTQ